MSTPEDGGEGSCRENQLKEKKMPDEKEHTLGEKMDEAMKNRMDEHDKREADRGEEVRRRIETMTCELCGSTTMSVCHFAGGVHARVCEKCVTALDQAIQATDIWQRRTTLDMKIKLMTGTNNAAEHAGELAEEDRVIRQDLARFSMLWLQEHGRK